MSRPRIEISEEAGVRYLHFGSGWIQGAMRIARPYALELEYTRDMMLCLLLRPDSAWPRSVLLIGLGAASLTKFLFRHRPKAQLTVVEIEPAVEPVARQYFKLPDEPARLSIVIADGVDYVADVQQRFDLILVDGFDAQARAGALEVLPFYVLCRSRLSEEGILVTNMLDRHRGFTTRTNWMRDAFSGRALVLPPCTSGNTVAFAATGAPIERDYDELIEDAQALRRQTGHNLLPTVARWKRGAAGTKSKGRILL